MRFMMSLPAPVGRENFAPKLELAEMRTYSDEMRKAGVLLLVEGPGPGSQATGIRVLDGKRVSTDGPFLDIKETLAGFWLIEVKCARKRSRGPAAAGFRRAGWWKSGRSLRTRISRRNRRTGPKKTKLRRLSISGFCLRRLNEGQ